jgi:hypothetical protein
LLLEQHFTKTPKSDTGLTNLVAKLRLLFTALETKFSQTNLVLALVAKTLPPVKMKATMRPNAVGEPERTYLKERG